MKIFISYLVLIAAIINSSCSKDGGINSGNFECEVDGKSYSNKGIVTANRILGLGFSSDIVTVSASLGIIRNISVTFSADGVVLDEPIKLYALDNSANTIMYTDGKYQDFNHNFMEENEFIGELTITEFTNSAGAQVSGNFEGKLRSKKGEEVEIKNAVFTASILN